MVFILILYTLAFAFLIATCYVIRLKKHHVFAKIINSLGFIAVATYGYVVTGHNELYFSMLPAFILCFCGDVLLAIEDKKGAKKYFLAGLCSFLLGHIVFVWAFCKRVPFSFYELIFPAIAVIITLLLVRMKYMNVGKMRNCILVYSFFVALLFSKAVSLVLLNGTSLSNILLLIGSFLFLVSDAIILFLYFYERKYKLAKFFNLLTYYAGLFLIALSLSY